jgi:hypothetical protein
MFFHWRWLTRTCQLSSCGNHPTCTVWIFARPPPAPSPLRSRPPPPPEGAHWGCSPRRKLVSVGERHLERLSRRTFSDQVGCDCIFGSWVLQIWNCEILKSEWRTELRSFTPAQDNTNKESMSAAFIVVWKCATHEKTFIAKILSTISKKQVLFFLLVDADTIMTVIAINLYYNYHN